jgi:hypothetical protein
MLSEEELDRKYKEKVAEFLRRAESENYIDTHNFPEFPPGFVCKWCRHSRLIVHLHQLRCGEDPPEEKEDDNTYPWEGMEALPITIEQARRQYGKMAQANSLAIDSRPMIKGPAW